MGEAEGLVEGVSEEWDLVLSAVEASIHNEQAAWWVSFGVLILVLKNIKLVASG